MIPYGKQTIDSADIESVIEILRSDWLTTGPKVEEFEALFAEVVHSGHAVAVNSGTAALHSAMYALGIGPDSEVIVPAMTFAASANCVVFQGGVPVFVDVEDDTLLIDPGKVEARITERTKAVVAVDYAGQPCDYDALREITDAHGIALVSDACHALGGAYKRRPVGSLADLSTFSFHPVKNITTGEGGMITTDDAALAQRMRLFRSHGITADHRMRAITSSWYYEMLDLGYNYRLTDFQCALGIVQLGKLVGWIERRREIANRYDLAFSAVPGLSLLRKSPDVSHAYHLYVIRLAPGSRRSRESLFHLLRDAGIGVNVHYIPVHLHPYYRQKFGTRPGLCPVAEKAYEEILSLPIFPAMSDEQVDTVIEVILRLMKC